MWYKLSVLLLVVVTFFGLVCFFCCSNAEVLQLKIKNAVVVSSILKGSSTLIEVEIIGGKAPYEVGVSGGKGKAIFFETSTSGKFKFLIKGEALFGFEEIESLMVGLVVKDSGGDVSEVFFIEKDPLP